MQSTRHDRYPHVFTPVDIGPVRIRNRFYQSPHAMPFNIGGKATDDYVRYAQERAEGGCGLIMVSMTVPERAKSVQPSPSHSRNIPSLRAVTDVVHGAGAKIFVEPFYQWLAAGNWQPGSPPAPALGPSPAQADYYGKRSCTRGMDKAEIKGMLAAIREATENLLEAGFDGIMVHASHGALLEQFLSPYFNRRTDEYGGTLTNRMRLMVETLSTVREAAKGRMAVGMRFNCDEMLPGGYDRDDAAEVLGRLQEQKLLDFVDLDIGVEPEQFYIGMPSVFVDPLPYRPFVERMRKAITDVPILSVLGRLTEISQAEEAIASGLCDMVGAARALMAEPYLVKNAFDGNEGLSRTCIACNACMAAGQDGAQVCAINPASYRERHWGAATIARAAFTKSVVVVGGGPAGLEAARVCALRGHRVVLIERADRLGGNLAVWSTIPGREFYNKAVEWWTRELNRLGVDVRLGTFADSGLMESLAPDAVIVATGARYCPEGRSNHVDAPIPGFDSELVTTPEVLIRDGVRKAGHAVILNGDGMQTAVGVAELLADAGCEVTIVTPGFSPLSPRVVAAQEARFIMKRMAAAGVNMIANSWIAEIAEDSVMAYDIYSERRTGIKNVSQVVLCTGRVPHNDLEYEMAGKVEQLFVVGDALAPRIWAAAAYEGHKFARMVGEPEAPTTFAEAYFRKDPDTLYPVAAEELRPLN